MPSTAAYRHAIATSATLAEAAEKLGVTGSAVTLWRQRQGLEPLTPGPPQTERVCPVSPDPQHVSGPEFDRLFSDLGVKETAAALNMSLAAVSQRAARRGLRQPGQQWKTLVQIQDGDGRVRQWTVNPQVAPALASVLEMLTGLQAARPRSAA